MTTIILKLKPLLTLSDAAFEQLCHHNPEMRLERTATGELIAMAPTVSESGYYNASFIAQLWNWNQQTQLGVVFDSSAGFTLPNGAIRSPDASWIRQECWDSLLPQQKRKFAPICPDFVLELLSPSDELTETQGKLEEYLANGTRLGWLIDTQSQQAMIYRPEQPIEVLHRPALLLGEEVLPGFTLQLQFLWPPL
ncbi:Uma2 family endonuclease [Anthocerotibacter panamensis]|uniref:Uma2 family endonuclease n=1 Tax=Anthocerotibacter panamensis TaxID=2857077 RepID=UPI001C402BD7|nr:Uma2 family endonuclease [Anthocerotibacter panamensis]